MATEPITVTDSDIQSLEKKLVQFAQTLPQVEQMYLAAMLASGIANPDEVAGFFRRVPGESRDERHADSIEVVDGTGTRTPVQSLQGWMSNLGVKV